MAAPKTTRELNVAIKAYVHAKHQMTTAQIEAAVADQTSRVAAAKERVAAEEQALNGFRQALAERKK